MRRLPGLVAVALLLAGCGTSSERAPGGGIPPSLLAQARTIGRGERFVPPVRGPAGSPCRAPLGHRLAAHVELFAANHVVLVGAGVGTRPPRVVSAARIVRAGCFGPVVTLDPTGVVLVRPGLPPTLSALFRAWGEPLTKSRLASFSAGRGRRVVAFVDGRPWRGTVADLPLTDHAEIVLEVGPYVPPHRSYTFPPIPPASIS